MDEDSEDEEEVLSKSGTSEGDEGDEESADVLIAREVERRGSKEG